MKSNDPTAVQLLDGSKKALENAEALHASAAAVAEIKNYGHATAMIILATEESIKSLLYLFYAVSGDKPDSLEKVLKSHRAKQALGLLIKQALVTVDDHVESIDWSEPVTSIEELTERLELSRPMTQLLAAFEGDQPVFSGDDSDWWDSVNLKKMEGLYVEWGGERWDSPLSMAEDEFFRQQQMYEKLLSFSQQMIAAVNEHTLEVLQKIYAPLAESIGHLNTLTE